MTAGAPSQDSLGGRTLRGMVWAYGSYTVIRVLVLVFTAILARILSPADFGVVSLALIFIALTETFYDLGLTSALVILDKETAEDRADSVFIANFAVGVVLALIATVLSPLAAEFFDEPALLGLLPVLSLTLVIRTVGNTHYALAQRALDFRSRTLAEISDVAVRGVAGVTLAVAGFGPWSLVLGYVAGSLSFVVALWLFVPWRPRLRFRPHDVRSLLAFGGALTGVGLISAVISHVDDAFVGRVLGARELGLYTLAFKAPEVLVLGVAVVASRVLFPAFAAVDRTTMASAVLRAMRYTLLLCVPLSAALALLAEPITLLLFGRQWLPAVPATRALAVYALAITIEIPAGTYWKAIGRADVLLKLAVFRGFLVLASLAVVAERGILAVAVAQAATAVVFSALGIILAFRRLALGPRHLLSSAWPSAVSTVGASIAMFAITRASGPPFVILMAAGGAGAAVYLAGVWLFARAWLREIIALVDTRVASTSSGGVT